MSVSDFVCYVLKIPINVEGFTFVCEAINYCLEHDGSTKFYEHLQKVSGKAYACVERALRYAISKAFERMSTSDCEAIFHSQRMQSKEFIGTAMLYYRREFMNENKE